MARPDPRSPFVYDTRQLVRRPGTMVELTRVTVAPDDFGTDVVGVRAGDPLELAVRCESVVEGVLLTGSVKALATGACVRCLGPVSLPMTVEFQELFAYTDRAAHHHEVGDDTQDQRLLDGDLLDLESVVRDAVVPALPFQPVCRSDCPGLCPQCGASLADDPHHRHEVLDPRWAVLKRSAQGEQDADGPQHDSPDHRGR